MGVLKLTLYSNRSYIFLIHVRSSSMLRIGRVRINPNDHKELTLTITSFGLYNQ